MGALRLPGDCEFGDHFGRRVPDVVAALGALAECSSKLQSEPLKSDVGGQTRQLLQQVEGTCKTVVCALVDALGRPSEDAEAYDKMWALRHIGKQSEAARGWITEKGGVGTVVQAMARHRKHGRLLEEGTWLIYVLQGTSGFRELLDLSQAMPGEDALAVQQATAKAVRELAEQQRQRGKEGCRAWEDGDELLLGLLQVLCRHSHPELLVECCKALNELIQAQPARGRLFLQHGGGKALLAALPGASLAGIWLMTTLVRGDSSAAQGLRSLGALDCLVKCGQSFPDRWQETMMTLGQVGGPLTVVRLMKSSESPKGLSVSLRALAKLTWEDLEEFRQQLPEVLQGLLSILHLVERSPQELAHALQALGGVQKFCAAQIPPGALAELNQAVAVQLGALNGEKVVAQAACTCLGHMATESELWRGPLRQALPALQQRWSSAGDSKESCGDLRDLLWAAGCIAGLPVLLDAMRQRPQSADLQFAGLMAIVDVCGEERGNQPGEAMLVVTAAMQLHRAVTNVQSAGCEALGVLSDQVLPESLEAVIGAVRRFPFRYGVVSKGVLALRRWLEPREESFDTVAHMVQLLRDREWGNDLNRILKDFVNCSEIEFFENCLFTYSLLEGIPALLSQGAHGSTLMKLAAVQVLCDLCRSFKDRVTCEAEAIRRCASGLLASEVDQGYSGELSEQVVELQRRCEVLEGLLR